MRAYSCGGEWEGSIQVGSPWNIVSPQQTARLRADEEKLLIDTRQANIYLRPGTVLRIERAGALPWFWRGILIHHRLARYDRCIGFVPASSSTGELLERLQQLGYWVLK
jgi:hypothetical protein